MASESNSSTNSGGMFVSLLTLLFIALKLTGHIGWSWWWVLSPLWISTAIVVVILMPIFAYLLLTRK